MTQNKTNNFLLLMALLAVVLVGTWAVYLYSNRPPVDTAALYQSEMNQLQTVSTSDDTEEISDDIDATELEDLDKDLDQIDSLL